MDLEKEIKDILFEIGKEIKVHKLIDGNLIIEIDYDKYTISIMELIKKYLSSNSKSLYINLKFGLSLVPIYLGAPACGDLNDPN